MGAWCLSRAPLGLSKVLPVGSTMPVKRRAGAALERPKLKQQLVGKNFWAHARMVHGRLKRMV